MLLKNLEDREWSERMTDRKGEIETGKQREIERHTKQLSAQTDRETEKQETEKQRNGVAC